MLPDPNAPAETPDWLPILDAELNALPAKYREPLLLCELQGTSRADAAKLLGIPEGTLSSRLSRGRDLLRRRLLKHGTLLPASGLATLLTAGSVGRAALPIGLLTKTSEVAAVAATGAALTGVVPAGAAQLMDEVIKGMFLMKLKAVSGAILVAGLVAVGVLAAVPGGAPGQANGKKPLAKVEEANPQVAKPVADGKGQTDRDRVQGLWVLEKVEFGTEIAADEQKDTKECIGKTQFLIAGDIWWLLDPRTKLSEGVEPYLSKLNSGKNPKWLDLVSSRSDTSHTMRSIYELDGDKLRFCVGSAFRPAEFNTREESFTNVWHFRREKMPPAAGEPAVVGSWSGPRVHEGGSQGVSDQRVEILDGYLFACIHSEQFNGLWIGGRYTVDTTKNPKWIDLELVAPYPKKDEKAASVTKLYGCYEVVDGGLKLALSTTGKRVQRPLDFDGAGEALVFDLKPTKEPLVVPSTATNAEPKAKDKAPPPPPKITLPGGPADERIPKLMKDFPEDQTNYSPRRSVGIPVNIDGITKLPKKPSEFQLYFNSNGSPFHKGPKFSLDRLQVLEDGKKGFLFDAQQDGDYGFAIQFIYPDGTTNVKDEELSPQHRIIIDTTPPTIAISSLGYGVEWTATDRNLNYDSIELQCRYTTDLAWTTVNDRAFRSVDGYGWTIPADKVLEVRVLAKDRAGNESISKVVRLPAEGAKSKVVEQAPSPRSKHKPTEQEEDEPIRKLMKDGKFAEAQAYIEEHISNAKGLHRAKQMLWFGICHMERASSEKPTTADELRNEAKEIFREAIREVNRADEGVDSKKREWVRRQAELHILKAFLQLGKPFELLLEASPLLDKYKGTTDELIVLSRVYHAFKQQGETDLAKATRSEMKALFDKLKDKPDAFPAEQGEYSKSYWEKVWFSEKAGAKP